MCKKQRLGAGRESVANVLRYTMPRRRRSSREHVHAGTGEGAWTIYSATKRIGNVFGASTAEDARAAWEKARGPGAVHVVPIDAPTPEGIVVRIDPPHSTP